MSQQTIEKPQLFSDLSEQDASSVNGGCNYYYSSSYYPRYRSRYRSYRRYRSTYYGYSYPRYRRSYSYVSYYQPRYSSYNCW